MKECFTAVIFKKPIPVTVSVKYPEKIFQIYQRLAAVRPAPACDQFSEIPFNHRSVILRNIGKGYGTPSPSVAGGYPCPRKLCSMPDILFHFLPLVIKIMDEFRKTVFEGKIMDPVFTASFSSGIMLIQISDESFILLV